MLPLGGSSKLARHPEKTKNQGACDFDFCFIQDLLAYGIAQRVKIDSVGNQTFFTKSKILEKAVSQAQNDEVIFYRWITAFCLNRP